MLSRIGLKIDPQQRPPVQVTKLPTTLFAFLRVPLTHLGRWFAYICLHMLPDYLSTEFILQTNYLSQRKNSSLV